MDDASVKDFDLNKNDKNGALVYFKVNNGVDIAV